MGISRRNFIKGAGSTFAMSGLMSSTALSSMSKALAGTGTQKIFHATHYGAFNAIVENGVLKDVETLSQIDARPTVMLTKGVVERTYHRSRVKYPMVRKSWLENWDKPGKRRPELRNNEPYVRVDWDTALKLVSKEILDNIEKHGNESIFNSSYGGWSHAGLMRPNVLQGRLFNLLGGSSMTVGDYSGGASQVSLPHIVGDMEVYSAPNSLATSDGQHRYHGLDRLRPIQKQPYRISCCRPPNVSKLGKNPRCRREIPLNQPTIHHHRRLGEF